MSISYQKKNLVVFMHGKVVNVKFTGSVIQSFSFRRSFSFMQWFIITVQTVFIFVCMRKRVGTMRLWDGDWWRCVHRSAWMGDTVRVWSQSKWCAERSASHHIRWWILLNHLPILTHLIILEGKTSKTILAISISKHIIVLVLLQNHYLPMIREKVINHSNESTKHLSD